MNKVSKLKLYGDDFEKHYYDVFISDFFPSYERFWELYIFTLRNRSEEVHYYIRNENEYQNYIAQLHYSILRSLIRTYSIFLKLSSENHHHHYIDDFIDAMSRLYTAQDLAFEFLFRMKSKEIDKVYCRNTSEKLRKKWNKPNELEPIRQYRNLLVHGVNLPSKLVSGKYFLPKIGVEKELNNWSLAIKYMVNEIKEKEYFESMDNILIYSFKTTTSYFEKEWGEVLLNK